MSTQPPAQTQTPGKLGMLLSLVPCIVAAVVAWYAVVDHWPALVFLGAVLLLLVGAVFWFINLLKYYRYRGGLNRGP